MLIEKEITEKVIGAAIEVHRHLGPGLLESAYEECLTDEFITRGVQFERQKPMPVVYKDAMLECGYRLHFLVEGKVVVEIKSVDEIHPVHKAQLITYLRLSGAKVGLLINFNATTLKQGITRMIL